MVEIEPYCRKVLKKHWPDVPLFGDVREVSADDVGAVDVIYGGFPCQPFSLASHRREGKADDRYLWPEFSRLVGEIKPLWVVAENVPGILSLAADDVCEDLERWGYSVGIWNFEAASVGAPHHRSRIFFVAYAGREYHERKPYAGESGRASETGYADDAEYTGSLLRAVASNAFGERRKEQRRPGTRETGHAVAGRDSGRGAQSGMGRVADGLPNWLDGDGGIARIAAPRLKDRRARLRALGNAVVPAQAYPIFKAIMEVENEERHDRP